MTENLLTVREVCELTGLTHQQVMRRIRNGTIPAEKLGWQWVVKKEAITSLK